MIPNTLAIHCPELAEEGIAYFAELFLDAFESGDEADIPQNSFVSATVTHVTTTGAEFLTAAPGLAFWDRSPPPSGATAQTGPHGVFLVLGEFYVQQNSAGAFSLPPSTYVLVEETATATPVQIGVGLFSQ